MYAQYDPFWIEKVLDNIISNANKFTKDGELKITLEKKKTRVKFSISDSGRGITKENLPHIFDKFFEGQKQTGTGTGLGLYICKKVVEAHGGKIGASSLGPDRGATIWFTLPV